MEPRKRDDLHKAGHYEIQGETIAKFEFFDNGFNPYSRYLDVDKVDLILRQRIGSSISYVEVQVKYGRLYDCTPKWQQQHFDHTSWKFFRPSDFANSHENFFVAYVLAHPSGYKSDIFIFPGRIFNELINKAIPSVTKSGLQYRVYIAHGHTDNKWYLWTAPKFDTLPGNTIDVTEYRRNISALGQPYSIDMPIAE